MSKNGEEPTNHCESKTTCAMSSEIQEIKSDVKEIKIALLGNQFSPIGLIQRMIAIEAELAAIKKWKWRTMGWVAGVSSAISVGLTLLAMFTSSF